MTLGKMIRAIRDDLGLTQAAMAAVLSISDAYMSQLESGKRTAELRYKDDVYWNLARIASRGVPRHCWETYVTLVGLDMEWRDPMIYEVLGRHFYQRFLAEERQVNQRAPGQMRVWRKKARRMRRASNF